MTLATNKSTKILIGNFIDTYLEVSKKDEAKQKAFEIVDLALDESETNSKEFATKGDIAALREETRSGIATLREETKNSIAALREETKSDIAALREETRSDIAALREETRGDIAALKSDVATIKNDIKTMEARLENKIIDSKYDLLKWIFAAQVAVTSLAVAIIKLF